MQIYILDQDGKIKGTLSSEAKTHMATPFFDDEYVMDLQTGAETFTFSTIAKTNQAKNLVVGNYIAFRYDEEYKVFQITEATDEHNSEFITTVYCEMSGIELINEPLRPRSYPSSSLRQFVTSVLSNTEWQVGYIDSRLTEVHTIEMTDYGTVYSTLQKYVVENYKGELAFRVEYSKGRIVGKYVDVYAERGSFKGFRFSYDKNMDRVKRTIDSSELATALIGVGKDNLTFKNVSSSDKPVNQDWIGDEESYKRWNKNGNHIFGVFKYDTESEGELLKLTREELQKRKNPKITYELGINLFGNDDLNIGDTVYVVDNEFSPPLHLSARVNQLKISFTDKDNNECVLANFKEVKSRITDEMRQIASLIDSKFPIGTDSIKNGAITSDKVGEGAIGGNHVAHDTLIADHIKANQIKTDHLEANSITAEKIKTNEIKTDHLQAESVTTDKLQANSVTSEKIEASAIHGGHLSSNLIESSHIKADQILAEHIKANSIEADHLKAESIKTEHLQAKSISADKLQTNSITTDHLQAKSVSADKLQADIIEGTHIKGEVIEGSHIKGEAITGTHIQGETITGNHIQGQTIEGTHIKGQTIEGTHLKGETIEGTHIKGDTIEGTHIKGESISSNHIQSNSIETGHLNADIITSDHIQSGSITADNIGALQINTEHLQADSVNADKLQANSINTEHLNANIIDAEHIKSNTITAEQIKANTITGNEIKGQTITGDHIQGNTIGASHIQANAIGSNQIQTGALTSDKMVIANGFIKDAMIDNINASKIKTGTIDTSKVTIESPKGNIVIADATQQFKDKNGNVRVQIGEDAQGDFTFQVLDETGTGVLIDHNGIKEKAISNGLIKNEMIGNGEIDGSKVDIDSLVTKLNSDGTTTILGSKVQIDTTGQTLNVVFKELNDKIDSIEVGGGDNSERFEALETAINVEQGRINTLISNTTIEKDGTITTLKDAHSKLEQTVSGLNSTVSATTTKLNNLSVGGKNLIWYTDFKRYNTDKWRSYNANNGSIAFDNDNGWAILTGKVEGVNGITPLTTQYNTVDEITSEETYQVSFTAYVESGTLGLDYCYIMSNEGNLGSIQGYPTITTTPTRYVMSVKPTQTRKQFGVMIGTRKLIVGNKLFVKDIKLEKGTLATDYSVSPHDVSMEVTHAESLIKQNADEIQLKVDVNGIKSAIALDESGVKIGGEHIDLEGQVTIKSLDSKLSEVFGEEYGTTVIDGGKIKTGSVTADKVDVHNLTVKDKNDKVSLHISEEGSVSMSGDLTSYDFSEVENTGWSLTKEGNAILNNATVRGSVILPNGGITNQGDNVRFWAGSDYENRENAPFKVLQDGSIHATKGHFGGTFTGRLEIGDIVLEDTDKGYLQMNDNDGSKVIHIGEEEVYFKPTAMFGDENSNLKIDTANTILKNKVFSVVKTSGDVQSTVLKVNPNDSNFLELNGTHTLKTNNSTLEIIGNHTQFSNDVTVVGDLSSDNMVVGEMRMERKNDVGNKGLDFIFI